MRERMRALIAKSWGKQQKNPDKPDEAEKAYRILIAERL